MKRDITNYNKKPMKSISLNNLPLKFLLLITVFLILIFPLVSAAEIEMKSGFSQGETLLAVVSGNFLDQITRDNVFFYQDHVRIPMTYEVGKINNAFYIYALLVGKTQGNYSVVIRDVRYMKGIRESNEDIVRNFTITDNTAAFYVKPGFLITSGDFFLEVQNLLDKRTTITVNTSESFNSVSSLELLSGETKKINFVLNAENQAFENIELGSENTSYSVPVFVDKPEKIGEDNMSFKFEPKIVSVSMATGSDSKRIIYLLNTGSLDIENISFFIPLVLEPYITISPEIIDNLGNGSAKQIEIFVNSGEEEMTLEGKITAKAENLTTSFTLNLDFIEDYIPAEGEEEEEILTTCSQINGTICTQEQNCTGDFVDTSDNVCCLATCEQIEKKSSTGKYIGWGLVAIVILFLFWFFKRYKRVRPKVDLLKIGQGKR